MTIKHEAITTAPDGTVQSAGSTKPLYTIQLLDGSTVGGIIYEEQHFLLVGNATRIRLGTFPEGCELHIPYAAIKYYYIQQ